jgi:hypothetical protein
MSSLSDLSDLSGMLDPSILRAGNKKGANMVDMAPYLPLDYRRPTDWPISRL